MKRYFIGVILLVGLSENGVWAEEIEAKLDALKAFKVEQKVIRVAYNPFMDEKHMDAIKNGSSELLETKKALQLLSVLNKKAFISGKWYAVGDAIEGGKIVAIEPTKVKIKEGNKVKTLTFEEKKSLLHIKDSKK